MSKITVQDIKDLGFAQPLYSVIADSESAYNELVTAVIAEQADELLERIGTTAYNAAANATYVKKAEKCLSAAEMLQRRINIILGSKQGKGDEIGIENERRQRQDYLDKAESEIAKLAQGVTTDSATGDFACGSLVTTHFE